MTLPVSDAPDAPERYRVFGRSLLADRALPGLPVAPPGDDGLSRFWTLRTDDARSGVPGHRDGAVANARVTWSGGIVASSAESALGREIVISDTGRFTLDADGSAIVHAAPIGVDRSAVALDLIGTVLPFALHAGGAWCLHASAVACADGVIAFIAPRGTGKSTLAAACLQAGCALVADDVVVLHAAPHGVRVTPSGVPLRMHERTARQVGAAHDAGDAWGKVRVDGARSADESPLAALYMLSAVTAEAPVAREPRTGRAAALALFTNGKITELLGAAGAGEALARCTALTAAAPMFDLAVPRDLARLADVTAALLQWHGGPVAVA